MRPSKDTDLEALIIKEHQEDAYSKILLEGMDLVKERKKKIERNAVTPMVIETGGGSYASSSCVSTMSKSTSGSRTGTVQWSETADQGRELTKGAGCQKSRKI